MISVPWSTFGTCHIDFETIAPSTSSDKLLSKPPSRLMNFENVISLLTYPKYLIERDIIHIFHNLNKEC